ncbi:MAG: metal-dependent transcriptional regulator [archaeon]
MPKEEIEEYLETIYDLSEKLENKKTVKTSQIADYLKIRAASVTEAVQRLKENGFVEYEAYQGVLLTKKGLQIALKIKRKHRLLECFLHDILKIKKGMHEQACKMEHYLSDNAEKALSKFLGNPKKCPDGKEIPLSNRVMPKKEITGEKGIGKNIIRLNSLKKGGKGRIFAIKGNEKAVQRLSDLGLLPNTKISIIAEAPLKGPIKILVRGSHLAISREIANDIYVEI